LHDFYIASRGSPSRITISSSRKSNWTRERKFEDKGFSGLKGMLPCYTEQCHDQAHAALRDVNDEDVTQGFDSLGASPVLLHLDRGSSSLALASQTHPSTIRPHYSAWA
jgi:hypothetical protein